MLLFLVVVFVALWWWNNRAIKPVELSLDEKTTLERKLTAINPEFIDRGEGPMGSEFDVETEIDPAPTYEKGEKEFEITERELNGMVNEYTELGDQVKFELVDGAVHARIATDLDEDLPIVGGRNLKARARFFIETLDGVPRLVLDDLTVWGISVPNDWLGGLKGQNLLGEVLGDGGKTSLAGIESLEVERGKLVIRLAE